MNKEKTTQCIGPIRADLSSSSTSSRWDQRIHTRLKHTSTHKHQQHRWTLKRLTSRRRWQPTSFSTLAIVATWWGRSRRRRGAPSPLPLELAEGRVRAPPPPSLETIVASPRVGSNRGEGTTTAAAITVVRRFPSHRIWWRGGHGCRPRHHQRPPSPPIPLPPLKLDLAKGRVRPPPLAPPWAAAVTEKSERGERERQDRDKDVWNG